ncbi:MAG: L,D-transpeptidase family protein [Xenococcaceae cyanobacterium]
MQTNKWNTKNKLLEVLLILVCISLFYWLLVRFGFVFSIAKLPEVLCLEKCPSDPKFHTLLSSDRFLNEKKTIEQIINSKIDKNKISLALEKSKHRLTLYYDRQAVKSYRVVFGDNPIGDKLAEGDRKTPEGIVSVRDLYPHPQWSKFIWLDYPNPQSWRKHFQAKAEGKIAWYLPIGGAVGIHGVPPNSDNWISDRVNWTWGCPSLKNNDIDEIYRFVQKGTLVEIFP